jgi:23S rRNA pseudouridine2605 synthase
MGTRLNKYLAQCGLGSRRNVEVLITAGRIRVNGKATADLSTIVEPGDRVTMDGRPIALLERHSYLIMNKPRGYITTLSDEKNRPTVMDLVPEKYRKSGIYPVGRLDRETSGLLLLTNDGDLAYRLTRPDFHIPKEYMAEIDRPLEETDRLKICKGVYIPQLEIKTRQAQVECADEYRLRIRIILTEGKNRQIRYTLSNLGYKIRSLERTAYGTIRMNRLRKGSCRVLTVPELQALKKMTGL